MKKYKNILLTFITILSFIFIIPNAYADEIEYVEDINLSEGKIEVNDKFKVGRDTYKVTEINKDKIYIGSIKNRNELDIYHFEVDVYERGSSSVETSRKFVKLKDLCDETYTEDNKVINVCKVTKIKNKDIGDMINIQREYANKIKDTNRKNENGNISYEPVEREVYYSTDHKLGTNEFSSLLYVSDGNGSILENDDCSDNNGGKCYSFGDIESGEAENEKFDDDGVLTGDVETLIDSNGNIYISLRFLSEALGARVDWLAREINDDTDAVLIRFYDSENYCKEYDIEFTQNNKDFEGMYKEFINALKAKENHMSFDLKYTFRSENGTESGKAKWNTLFLGGFAAENGYVFWDYEKKKVVFQYSANKPEGIQDIDFQKICPSSNYDSDGQLETLDECIEIMGLIRYYGVPIPINLLRSENDTCRFDEGHFEDDNYYENINNYDAIVIGDTHIQKISQIIDDDYDINYHVTLYKDDFEEELDNIIEELDSDESYTIVFNMGNDEILKIATSNKSNSKKSDAIEDLANEYANIYSDFYEKIEDYNIDLHIIQNTPINTGNNDDNEYVEEFWEILLEELENNDLDNVIDYFEFDYDDVNIKFKNDDELVYTDKTYKSLFKEIINYIGLD